MEKNEENIENTSKQKVNIIIIGGGIAGLSAANHLIKNGVNDFLLLEARKRLGGRIIQIQLGSEKIELGANWIHGVLGNPIYEFAMQHGLVDILQTPKPHKVVAATEGGKQVPFPVLHEIMEAYLCFLKKCEEYFISQYLPPEGIYSVGDHIRLEIDLYLDKFKDKSEQHLRKLIFDCLLKRETCISGCDDMKEIDLLELGSYTELQGGNIVLPGGYSSILEPLIRGIPSCSILREHPVKTIYWSKNSNNCNGNESDDSDKTVIDESIKPDSNSDYNVKIVCENNKIFYSDHVICTVPLGVLKHHVNSLFHPQLPEAKIEAINNLLFGTVDKIILEYERPFLNPNITEVMLLWEDTDYSHDLKDIWFKKIYSFTKLSDTHLLGWISGKEAEYMETLSNDVIIDKCTEILRKFLNDPFIPKPKTCVCTSWNSQPYTRGSYTALAVGSSQIDIENLAQPLYSRENQAKPVLLFAGEHTHNNFYSTVHGAYLSGITAANLLLSSHAPEDDTSKSDETSLSSWIQGISLT